MGLNLMLRDEIFQKGKEHIFTLASDIL